MGSKTLVIAAALTVIGSALRLAMCRLDRVLPTTPCSGSLRREHAITARPPTDRPYWWLILAPLAVARRHPKAG